MQNRRSHRRQLFVDLFLSEARHGSVPETIASTVGLGATFRSSLFQRVGVSAAAVSSLRRSMTGASVSLLLIAIISLNIVWGYPWMGVFAASVTMLGLGLMISRLFRPQITMDLSLPTHAPAGESFRARLHLLHHGRLPCFDLRIADFLPRRLRRVAAVFEVTPVRVEQIVAGGRCDLTLAMTCHQRGSIRFR